MKLTRLETRRYSWPLDPPLAAAWDPVPRTSYGETIVIVENEEGLRGYAGGAPVPDLTLLQSLLLDREIDHPGSVFQVCHSVDFHRGRNWTVEIAVWDLWARAAGQPLWQLLGGTGTFLMAYASTAERVAWEERVERVLAWQEAGVRAVKLRLSQMDWRLDLQLVEAVREAVGPQLVIMVDANQGWRMPGDIGSRWNLAIARQCALALADLDIYWLEEPLDTADWDDYAILREVSPVRIAAGEMVRSLAESRRLLEVVDVIQNDVALAGGVNGCRMVASWAREVDRIWSPHTWSTGFGLLANLHVAMAFSTSDFIEVPYDPPAWAPGRRDLMLPSPLAIESDGTIRVPDGPGLGMEPDLDALERYRIA